MTTAHHRKSRGRRLNGHARMVRIDELAARDGWFCAYCGCGLASGRPSTTIDEVVPLGRGGTTSHRNQVLACSPCNQRKADMTGDEFEHFLRRGGPPRSYFDWRIELKRRQRTLTVTPSE